MVIVNFAHPLTDDQRRQIERHVGRPIARVIDVPAQLDLATPLAPQVAGLIRSAGLSAHEWQTLPILVNLPGLSAIAAVLLAQIHGLVGHFPAAIRLRPVPGSVPVAFELAEVLDLQALRDEGRRLR